MFCTHSNQAWKMFQFEKPGASKCIDAEVAVSSRVHEDFARKRTELSPNALPLQAPVIRVDAISGRVTSEGDGRPGVLIDGFLSPAHTGSLKGMATSWCKTTGAPLLDALTAVHSISVGLHLLHSQNILHQDVKSDNILINVRMPTTNSTVPLHLHLNTVPHSTTMCCSSASLPQLS